MTHSHTRHHFQNIKLILLQIIVYRTEHNYIIPLAQEPIPMPRRARSRSQTSALTEDDQMSHGGDSYIFDEEPAANEEKFLVDVKEGSG